MANSIKLTEEVSKKMQELKNLACADDSIISQEAKEDILSAISTFEKEITEVDTEKKEIPKSSTKKTDNSLILKFASFADFMRSKVLDKSATTWNEPDVKFENLVRLTSSDMYSSYAEGHMPKSGYERYGMSIKDYRYNPDTKPLYRNVLSIIKDNIDRIDIDKCREDMSENDSNLSDLNTLALSGLFIYKVDDYFASDSRAVIDFPDAYLEIWIPTDKVSSKLTGKGTPAKYHAGSSNSYIPVLNGYVLEFDDVKDIILDLDMIIFPGSCFHLHGLHDAHTYLYRDKSNNNLVFRDEDMAENE